MDRIHLSSGTTRLRAALVLTVSAALALVGCSSTQNNASSGGASAQNAGAGSGSGFCSGKTFRFEAGGTPGDGFTDIIIKGAQQAEKDTGAKVEIMLAKWDQNTMVSQFRDAVAARPDGIAMMGHPGPAALEPVAKQAFDAKIPVDWLNVDVPDVRGKYGGGFSGANLAQQGGALGEQAAALLKPGDSAIVFGPFDNATRGVREIAAADAMEKAGMKVVRVIAPAAAYTNPSLLTPILTAAFLKNPETKMFVYGGAGIMGTIPQFMAAIKKKPGEVMNAGFDLSDGIIKAFEQGYMNVTADQQPFLQGYLPVLSLCMRTVYSLASLNNDLGAGFVTTQNYKVIQPLVQKGLR